MSPRAYARLGLGMEAQLVRGAEEVQRVLAQYGVLPCDDAVRDIS